MMKGKIHMAARRQVTNKLRAQYREASRADKSKILDHVVATTGMARSTARRMLTGPDIERPRVPDPEGTRPGIEEPDIARHERGTATSTSTRPGTTSDMDSANTDSHHLIQQELTTLALNPTISRAHSTFKCAAALDIITPTQVTGWCVDCLLYTSRCV